MNNMIRFNEFGKILKPRKWWKIALCVISIVGILFLIWWYFFKDKKEESPTLPDSISSLMVEINATKISDSITIKVISEETISYLFSITNESGQTLFQHESESLEYTFDVATLPVGKYFAIAKTNNEVPKIGMLGFEKV